MHVRIIGPEDAVLAQVTYDLLTGPRVNVPRIGEVVKVEERRYRVREVEWQTDPMTLTQECRIWVEELT